MICVSSLACALFRSRRLRGFPGERRAFAECVLQVDGNAVLPEQVGEGFIRQFLKGSHPVTAQLLQLVESILVELD
jgi:hypothetical protein